MTAIASSRSWLPAGDGPLNQPTQVQCKAVWRFGGPQCGPGRVESAVQVAELRLDGLCDEDFVEASGVATHAVMWSARGVSPSIRGPHPIATIDPSPLGLRVYGRTPPAALAAWILRGTRIPVATIFENLEARASLDDVLLWYDGLDRQQVQAVIKFAARSLDLPAAEG